MPRARQPQPKLLRPLLRRPIGLCGCLLRQWDSPKFVCFQTAMCMYTQVGCAGPSPPPDRRIFLQDRFGLSGVFDFFFACQRDNTYKWHPAGGMPQRRCLLIAFIPCQALHSPPLSSAGVVSVWIGPPFFSTGNTGDQSIRRGTPPPPPGGSRQPAALLPSPPPHRQVLLFILQLPRCWTVMYFCFRSCKIGPKKTRMEAGQGKFWKF